MKALKDKEGKPRLELLPPDVLRLAAKVFGYGANKYAREGSPGEWNWTRGTDWGDHYGALQRHLNSWWEGEDNDPESGHSHLGHALCCLMMLTGQVLRGVGHDDRCKVTRSPEGEPLQVGGGVDRYAHLRNAPGFNSPADLDADARARARVKERASRSADVAGIADRLGLVWVQCPCGARDCGSYESKEPEHIEPCPKTHPSAQDEPAPARRVTGSPGSIVSIR